MSINISASLLKDYIACSNQANFRLNYPDAQKQSVYMMIGNIVHKAIELYWNNKDSAIEYVESVMKAYKFSNREANTLKTYLYGFFDSFSNKLTDSDLIENFFKLKLDNNIYLVGKFDRVSGNSVYDWKAVSSPPNSIDDDVQFITYYHAYRKLYKKEPSDVYFASLSDGNLIKYNYDKMHFTELFDNIVPNLIVDIKTNNFKREGLFRKGVCYKCSYKQRCLNKEDTNVMDSGTITKR